MTMRDKLIRQQAAQWAQRLNTEDVTDAEHAEFLLWLGADPRHERAFDFETTTWFLIDQMVAERQHSGATLSSLPPLRPGLETSRRWTFRTMLPGMALAVAVLAVVVYLAIKPMVPTYTTQTAEMREIHLADGSTAVLNTRSTLEVQLSAQERHVNLIDGEAYFDVRHDPARPFVVHVGPTQVRVTGTRFDVYCRRNALHHDVVLTVLSGTVDVAGPGPAGGSPWHRQLHANQAMTYEPTGVTAEVHGIAADRHVQWRLHRLDITDIPLREVVAELSRYTDTPIHIQDSRLDDLRFATSLDLRDIHAALEKLQANGPVRIEPSGYGFILRYRPEFAPTPTAPAGEHR
jgi:transmembrane sensor